MRTKQLKPTKTQQALAELFNEKAERLLKRPIGQFKVEAPSNAKTGHDYGFWAELSSFHWLDERLEYDGRVTNQFQKFFEKEHGDSRFSLEGMKDFPIYLREKGKHVAGLNGEEADRFSVTTVGNHNTLLDNEDFSFVYFEIDDQPYILLQIYDCGRIKAFRVVVEGEKMYYFNDCRIFAVRPEDEDKHQTKFDFLHEAESSTPKLICWGGTDNSFRLVEGHKLLTAAMPQQLEDYPMTDDPALRGKGYIYWVDDGDEYRLYCPVTGWQLQVMSD